MKVRWTRDLRTSSSRPSGDNTLLSVRSLSGGFSEVSDKAFLSYSESYSLVKFLIETYGQDKMTALLVSLRDGTTIDEALQQTYGFDVDGLEDAWRQAIEAEPRAVSAQPTAQATPTFVPTIVPISGSSGKVELQATPTAIPTSSSNGQPTEAAPPQQGRPPLALTLILLGLCCAVHPVDRDRDPGSYHPAPESTKGRQQCTINSSTARNTMVRAPFVKILSLFFIFAFLVTPVTPRTVLALQVDVPLNEALVLSGGESTNPRDYDPATTLGSGDKLVFSGLVSLDPKLNLITRPGRSRGMSAQMGRSTPSICVKTPNSTMASPSPPRM